MRIFLVIIFSICLLSGNCFALDISAQSAILYEPSTQTVLYSKEIDTQREIASTTKIMTAVVVLENASLDDVVTVPKSCTGIEGTSMYLKENEKLSVSDLLYGMMLRSGNDAAVALAAYVGRGDVEVFVSMMNETAQRIGMENTLFKNPNGLSADGHVSTASDMARLAAYAMKIPEFAKIVSSKEKAVAGRVLSNHNKMLRLYDGANGIKTGYTKAAGRCLVSSAERNGLKLIAVTLRAPDDWNDHTKLFDFGFERYSIFQDDNTIPSVAVVGGEKAFISVAPACNVKILKENSERIERDIYIPKFLYAPIYRGDVVGKIVYKSNGKVLDTASIISCNSVAVYEEEKLLDKFFNLFGRLKKYVE